MPYQYYVLFDGYTKLSEDGKSMKTNCSCTLIKGPKNIIVDTMTAWDGAKIVAALKNHGLEPKDIHYVVSTHGHSDHIGNNNLFLEATHIVGRSISKKDIYYLEHLADFEDGKPFEICQAINVVATPGHTLQDVSVLLEVRGECVAIVGDLFENQNDIEDERIWLDVGSENPELQRKNRKNIVEIADVIVPGHGPKFDVTEEIKEKFRNS